MTIIISLVIGLAAGFAINYAVTFRTGQMRNIAICVVGAFVGGAVVPWALGVPNAWTAIIGSVIGIVIGLWIALTAAKRT
jgi:uncharacterized membrane protein YeaQ/YmgE (transglycosylase-associated protein family)